MSLILNMNKDKKTSLRDSIIVSQISQNFLPHIMFNKFLSKPFDHPILIHKADLNVKQQNITQKLFIPSSNTQLTFMSPNLRKLLNYE